MEWDSLLSSQKPPPRKGRRAGLSFFQSRDDGKHSSFEESLETSPNEGREDSSSPLGSNDQTQPVPPPRIRRAGGWADDTIKSSKKRGDSSNLIEKQRFQSPKKSFDSNEDIPSIPELDDYGEDDLKSLLSHGVSVAMSRVATYKELDAANEPYMKLDDIDLSPLVNHLDIADAPDIDDDDTPITWDLLYTKVNSELHSKTEATDSGSDDEEEE